MPGAQCTRSLVCDKNKHSSVVTTGPPEITRHSRTQWFYGLFRALPGDQACLTPSSRGKSAKLDTSFGVPEPHDFAVRFSIIRRALFARLTLPRPSHPAPNVRDDRETPPLCGTGWRELWI
jgi:hypothetical protein